MSTRLGRVLPLVYAWSVLSATLILLPVCSAQSVSVAEVSGIVSDSSGAALPGATVNITETDKQQPHTTVTDASGRYVFPNLPVGPYQIEVVASGFKLYRQTGIILQVGNNVQLNVTLQLGSMSEHVEVTADAAMVETRDTSISQVIDQQRIEELPLNGRQPTQLILLSGAALTTPGGGMVGSKNYFSSTTISVAGGQANGVNYMLDGGDHNDSMTNVNLPIPFPDALQEFSVQTSALPARFGLHPGAVVNAVTKSGSNELHGDLFEFLRNGDMNARNTFATVHDSLKRNQFGGTLGGKIIANKVFFFGGYQGTRTRSDPPQTISFTPTQAVLNGDFSAIESAGCVANGGRTLKDPLNGQAFPGNQIPTSRFNPEAVKLVTGYVPISTDPCGKITYGIPTTGDEDQIIGRVDWVHNSKHTLYGRYFLAQYKNPPVFDGVNALTTTAPGNWERAQAVTLGDSYTFSPTTLNSFHASFTRRRDNRDVASNNINPTDIGLNVSAPLPNFLQVSVSNYWSVGCGTCAAGHFNTNSWHFADDVDLIRGKHQMSFGVDFLRDQFNFINGWMQNGLWSFGSFTGDTGDTLANYMLGLPSDFQQSGVLQMATRAPVLAIYAQDSYRVTPHLTINFGLRWEPFFAAYDYFGYGSSFQKSAFDAGTRSTVFTNAPPGLLFYGDSGIPKAYFNNKLALFSPRVGVVWDPTGSGKQTIRVSGGILRDTAELFYAERLTTNAPYGNQIDIPTPPSFTNPYANYPGGSPFPVSYPPPSTFKFAPASVFVNMPLDTKPTYTAQWNFSYQRQLSANWLASVSYIGNKTTHIWVGEDINPAVYMPGATTGNTNQRRPLYLQNPAYGSYYSSITQSDQGANAHYAGALFSVQHRFAQHFTLLFNYTWSHCISDGDFGGELAGNYYQDPYNRAGNRGDCNFDVRHISNTSLVARSPMMNKGIVGHILSGWQFAPIVSVASGIGINITSGKDNSLTGIGLDRPDYVAGTDAYSADPNSRVFLNPAAFRQNAAGTFGNLGRDVIHGPGRINFDASLSRSFMLTERWRLEARGEAFNAINHVNYNNPTTALNSANFGKILGAADPRILQVSMKVHF
jgi:hypothetical protein